MKSLSFLGVPDLAVAEGDASPNPGYRCLAYSTVLSKLVRWNGTTWNAVDTTGGGGGSSVWTEVTINFGTKPTTSKSFVITDASVNSSQKIIVAPSGNPPSGRYSDDWEWDSINFAAKAGTGNFTVYASSNSPVEGTRNILYQVV
jgi:hypothetical protein